MVQKAIWIGALVVVAGMVNKYLIRSFWPVTPRTGS
jgi:hypothetical protein